MHSPSLAFALFLLFAFSLSFSRCSFRELRFSILSEKKKFLKKLLASFMNGLVLVLFQSDSKTGNKGS